MACDEKKPPCFEPFGLDEVMETWPIVRDELLAHARYCARVGSNRDAGRLMLAVQLADAGAAAMGCEVRPEAARGLDT